MNLSTLLRTSFVLCAVAALSLSTGCKSKKSMEPTGVDDVDIVAEGEDGFGVNEDIPMPAGNFQDLPRITDVSFSPVYFGTDNYEIAGSEFSKIDAVASYLQSNSRAVLVVEGHCDERGTEEYNMSLGEFRAQSVRSHLLNSGVDVDRIQTASFGKGRPAVSGSGESAWCRNRRAEFALYQR